MTLFANIFTQNQGVVRKQRALIHEVLSSGSTTVSDIVEKTRISKEVIVWNLLGMLKWGLVDVTGEQNRELVYSLKEV